MSNEEDILRSARKRKEKKNARKELFGQVMTIEKQQEYSGWKFSSRAKQDEFSRKPDLDVSQSSFKIQRT